MSHRNNNMGIYDMVTDVRLNILIEEVNNLRRIVKDLAKTVDSLCEVKQAGEVDVSKDCTDVQKVIQKKSWFSRKNLFYGIVGLTSSVCALYFTRNMPILPMDPRIKTSYK
jgi:hypothetical protein